MTRANAIDGAALELPAPPRLLPLARIRCLVDGVVTLGDAPGGERRFVPLRGGSVHGTRLCGEVLDGGIDWQTRRSDGALEIAAHYVVRAPDGGLIEVHSDGLRHGPAEVMARLARGEAVPRADYFFCTAMRFTTGAPAWQHLNRVLALAVGERQAMQVVLDVYEVT